MATTDIQTLVQHLAAVDEAYQRLRAVLFDPSPGVGDDDPSLTAEQRRAVEDLRRAEEALKLYRRNAYEGMPHRHNA
jgi:hypothetical protein